MSKVDKKSMAACTTRWRSHLDYSLCVGFVERAHLDQTHGYFNGACLLLAVQGYVEQNKHSAIDL